MASSSGGGAGPTPFISFSSSTKKFQVHEEAAAALARLKGPTAVLAVCGRARMGKSFLLNKLLDKLRVGGGSAAVAGFQVCGAVVKGRIEEQHKAAAQGLAQRALSHAPMIML